MTKCSICKKEIYDIRDSNNAFPFKGRCCNECNLKKVIPIRIALSQGYAMLFRVPLESYYKGSMSVIVYPERLKLEDLQEKVGGCIETISLPDDYVAIVNEEGRLQNLPINRVWSMFYLSSKTPTLVGNVLLMKKDQLKLK